MLTTLFALQLIFAAPIVADYAQACGKQAACKRGFECRGSCQPVHARDVEKPLGNRSVRVVLLNQTGVTLRRIGGGASHGKWSSAPPNYINPYDYGQWQTDSNGLATGTEAHAEFDIWVPQNGKMIKVGNTHIKWDNPFDGGNHYEATASPGFTIDREGGDGNHTTVFFYLRSPAQRDYKCADLWVSNHLSTKPNPTLDEFDEAIGVFTTAIKRTGIQGWTFTGCGAEAEAVVVRDAQHSTDGFWTIDVWLTKFRVGTMDAMAKYPGPRAIRIEVKPGRKAHDVLNDQANQRPRKGNKIRFSGRVFVDHGHFLEVHPDEPIVITAAK